MGESDTTLAYLEFAEHTEVESPSLHAWSVAVAQDTELLALLDTLPALKRQPNLLFAAARWHGATPGSSAELRKVALDRWDEVSATMLARSTQTNEVGRCATLLPVLGRVPGPLALVEVGCSAGLNLFPDLYGYRYRRDGVVVAALGAADAAAPVLDCQVSGDPPLPEVLPEVVWRAGIDLNPLDVRDDDAGAWLQTLVWPEHEDRRERLAAAAALVREQEPPLLVRGDLLAELPDLLEQVPAGATPVVFHSAVAAYLSEVEREALVTMMASVPGRWVSNEGETVLPSVSATAPAAGREGLPFVLGLDGRAVARTHGHGRALQWFDDGAATQTP